MSSLLNKIVDQDPIIGREKFISAAILVAFYQRGDELELIFEKRPTHVHRNAGDVGLPGGRREEGDASWQETAVRETMEELGVERTAIEVLGKLGTLFSPSGVLVEVYVGKLDIQSLDDLDFDEREVAYLFQVPLKFFFETEPEVYELAVETHPYNDKAGKRILFPAKELGLPERYHQPWRGQPRKVYLYRYGNEVIWGIAGEIVYEVAKRVKQALGRQAGTFLSGDDSQVSDV
ncbi:MAG: CoA pyrophosphatase [Anaerolineae bacterium]|nr:CoA pyrophosphatase [Anaerolineae bacterium]